MMEMVYTLLYVVVVTTLLCIGTAVGGLDLESMCLSREMCNRTMPGLDSQLFEEAGVVPCCVSCSCELDCVNVGNCCPDIGDVGPPIRPLECILPVTNPDDQLFFFEKEKMFGYIQRYRAVAECPDDTVDEVLRFKCEEKEAEYPEELVIVVDKHGHLFKNEFCARCNGVEGYTPWQLRLQGPIMKELLSYSPSQPFSEFKNSMFWSQPSDPYAYEGSRCFSSIDSCNVTGRLARDINPYVEEMCRDVSMYYMHFNVPHFGNAFVYKNPFCFLCNTESELAQTDHFCEFDTPIVSNRFGDLISAALSTLPTTDEREKTERQPWTCERDYVYDPFSDTCRQLVCPIYSSPVYGECHDTFENITGINLAVVLTAQINVMDEVEATDIVHKRFDILTKLEEVLSLTTNKCQRCRLTTWSKYRNNQVRLAFRVLYTTVNECHLEFLQTAMVTGVSAFASEIWMDPEDVRLIPSLLPGDMDLLNEGYVEIPFSDIDQPVFGLCSSYTIDFNYEVAFCPRFEFSEQAFDFLKKLKSPIPQSHVVNVGNQTKYVICADKYLAISTGNRPLGQHYLISAILVSLLFCFGDGFLLSLLHTMPKVHDFY